jgi:hypothetical protein
MTDDNDAVLKARGEWHRLTAEFEALMAKTPPPLSAEDTTRAHSLIEDLHAAEDDWLAAVTAKRGSA